MTSYYLIRTATGKDRAAYEAIGAIPPVRVWMPECWREKVIHRPRRVTHYRAPLTPGYLFAQVPAIYWPEVLQVREIVGKPEPIPSRVFEGISERRGPNGCILPRVPGVIDYLTAAAEAFAAREAEIDRERLEHGYVAPSYDPGQPLEVLAGAMAGLTVTYVGHERGRIVGMLQAMGRASRVLVSPVDVRAAPTTP